MRTVNSLDVHKDSIFMCVLDKQSIIVDEKFGVSTCGIKKEAAEKSLKVEVGLICVDKKISRRDGDKERGRKKL